MEAFALTGRNYHLYIIYPRVLPWDRSFCPFRACRENQASTLPHQLVNVVLKHSDTAAFFIH